MAPKTAPSCSFEFNNVTAMLLGVMFDEMFTLLPDLDGNLLISIFAYCSAKTLQALDCTCTAFRPTANPCSSGRTRSRVVTLLLV